MKKVKIHTLGCRTNQFDSEIIAKRLSEENYLTDIGNDEPEIVIINTCTVTGKADSKGRQIIRKSIEKYPNATIVVSGCSVKFNKEKIENINGVDFAVGPNSSDIIVKKITGKEVEHTPFYVVDKNHKRSRAQIKIQDGCNSFCSYCIVPYMRGAPISASMELIKKQFESLINNNFKEIVLTGIHTGSYNSNGNNLSKLLKELFTVSGNYRIRLSSIEPLDFTDELLELFIDNPKLVNHIHIPLQSGSDKILSNMHRTYDCKTFENIINKVKNVAPLIGIGTDVITGFPGETINDALETETFIKSLPFTYGHVFKFSSKEGTEAAKLKDDVRGDEKDRRSLILRNLFTEKNTSFLNKHIGKNEQGILEQSNDLLTSSYLKLKYIGKNALPGKDLIDIKIVKSNSGKIIAEDLN